MNLLRLQVIAQRLLLYIVKFMAYITSSNVRLNYMCRYNISMLYRELLFVQVALDQQRSINPVWTEMYLLLPTSVLYP